MSIPGGVAAGAMRHSERQRSWPGALVSRHFAFSKPVSEGLIRENAFESGYRERELGGIAWSLPKALRILNYHRLREGP